MLLFDIENIRSTGVKIDDLYLYSDSPRQINIGDKYGEFEVDEIKKDCIIYKNTEDIKFINTVKILDNRIKFKVADDRKLAYTYTIETKPGTYKLKGKSYDTNADEWVMDLTGFDFPAFSFDLDKGKGKGMSYESLRINFLNERVIAEDNAEYITSINKNEVSFLGHEYHVHEQESDFILTRMLLDEDEKSLRIGEPLLLKDGYVLSVSDITGVTVVVKLSKDGKVIESNIYDQGDKIVFTKPYNDMDVPFFECSIENMVGGTVFIDYIEQYSETPIELTTGKRYGAFEIKDITNDKIIMTNTEQITISDGKSILDNWIKFEVSGNEITPYVKKSL